MKCLLEKFTSVYFLNTSDYQTKSGFIEFKNTFFLRMFQDKQKDEFKRRSKNYLATNIQYLRKQKNLSQQKLAERLNLSRSNIASYENGKAEPRTDNLAEMARFFDVNLLQFIEVDLREVPWDQMLNAEQRIRDNITAALSDHGDTLENFKRKSEELKKILEGFRQFYHFRMKSYDEIPKELQALSQDFENLLSVMDSLQESNEEMLSYLQRLNL